MRLVLLVTLAVIVSGCSGKKVKEPEPEVTICLVDIKKDGETEQQEDEMSCVDNYGDRLETWFPLKKADNWVCVKPDDKGKIELHHRRLHRLLEQ